ncbi:MAG: type I-E CRISPR-associated endoribonuclease Cas2e [Armatimonadota bacterium]
MVVLVLEHVPTSLRGELSRWMIEPRAGVFIGTISAMVREKLWEHILKKAPECGVIMLHSAKTEQGFAVRTAGDTTRQVVDFEGISLIQRHDPTRSLHR